MEESRRAKETDRDVFEPTSKLPTTRPKNQNRQRTTEDNHHQTVITLRHIVWHQRSRPIVKDHPVVLRTLDKKGTKPIGAMK